MTTVPLSTTAQGQLCSLNTAHSRIASGEALMVAGDANLLAQLPAGNWIGGTIPYFMTPEGPRETHEHVYLQPLPVGEAPVRVELVSHEAFPELLAKAPQNGYSVVVVPFGTAIHTRYALEAHTLPGLFLNPVFGWVAGMHLEHIQDHQAAVFSGPDAQPAYERLAILHVELPADQNARIEVVNPYTAVEGPTIRFPQTALTATNAVIDGVERSFADYLLENSLGRERPLVADFMGTSVNVSLQSIDEVNGQVHFFAPVRADATYRFAAPCNDLHEAFEQRLRTLESRPSASCNCILNYVQLSGQSTPDCCGPMTFGEIAGQLLNQTLVALMLDNEG